MTVNCIKFGALLLCALILGTPNLAQQPQPLAPEHAAANAFERAVQTAGGPQLKRIYRKDLRDLCVHDARGRDFAIVGHERITYASEQELDSKMRGLVHQWQTTGSPSASFDPRDFRKLRRYAVADCGVVDKETKVVLAVYLSASDTYWANWNYLLWGWMK